MSRVTNINKTEFMSTLEATALYYLSWATNLLLKYRIYATLEATDALRR